MICPLRGTSRQSVDAMSIASAQTGEDASGQDGGCVTDTLDPVASAHCAEELLPVESGEITC